MEPGIISPNNIFKYEKNRIRRILLVYDKSEKVHFTQTKSNYSVTANRKKNDREPDINSPNNISKFGEKIGKGVFELVYDMFRSDRRTYVVKRLQDLLPPSIWRRRKKNTRDLKGKGRYRIS